MKRAYRNHEAFSDELSEESLDDAVVFRFRNFYNICQKLSRHVSTRTFLPQVGDPDFGETVCDAVSNSTSQGRSPRQVTGWRWASRRFMSHTARSKDTYRGTIR